MFKFVANLFSGQTPYSPIRKDVLKEYNTYRPNGAKELFCYVPFNNLLFTSLGKIYACTYNKHILVGEYPQNSIHQIWHGDELKKLQKHLANNDLNYGCQHCKHFVDKKKFTGLKPQSFDKYSDYKKHNYPQVMEFDLSNKCNLECIMCNAHTSSAIRQSAKLPPLPMVYDNAFLFQLKEFIPYLKECRFLGGEPFLIPIYFQIWDLIRELNPSINVFITTNGTTLTEKVKDTLANGSFELVVSIDSIRKERYEFIRKNASFESVMQNLDYFNGYVKSRGKALSLSFTTQRENWDELPEVIEFCNRKGIVFFNSYLSAPFELSLIYLTSDRLREIYNYLIKFNLPESNSLEKYNKTVFEDYLKYLLFYEDKNRNGIVYEEQKDNYEEGLMDERNANAVKKMIYNTPTTRTKYTNREELYAGIRSVSRTKANHSNEEIIQMLEELLATINNKEVESWILKDVSDATVESMVREVNRLSKAQLYMSICNRYGLNAKQK